MGNCVSGTKSVAVEGPLRTSSALEIPDRNISVVNENYKCEATSVKDPAQNLELRSVSESDEFGSTDLDLSFSKDESAEETNVQWNPSSCAAVYTCSNSEYSRRDLTFTSSPSNKPTNSADTVMPRSEYSSNSGSRSSEITSSSDESRLGNLPKVTESGNLDLESFKETVLSKMRRLSAGKKDKAKLMNALALLHSLDNAVVEAMNKVKKAHAKRSAKVAPLALAQENMQEQRALQSKERSTAANFGEDVAAISKCENRQ